MGKNENKCRKDGKGKRVGKLRGELPHRHVLYEAAVQSPDADLDFVDRLFKRKRGATCRRMREDFCGTAALSCEWVRRRPDNVAWGIDLHRPTLDWGRRHRLAHLGDAARRVRLRCADVLAPGTQKVDTVLAFNFSYSVFKRREVLRRYFEGVRGSLRRGGIFLVDAFGGQETMGEVKENKKIPASKDWDGRKVPAFTYVWEQARFNAVTHEILCHIHFRLPGGVKLRRAFTYDWRLWTLPELQELMGEAGFASSEVYLDGWDDERGEADGIYRRRTFFPNQDAWVAYVVGYA